MVDITSVVNVVIERISNAATVRDLNTIGILSTHTKFTENYRIYTKASDLLTDGFTTTDYAYVAAQRIFSQNPKSQRVVVGKKLAADSYTIAVNKFISAYNKFLWLVTDATAPDDILEVANYLETTEKFYAARDSSAEALDLEDDTDIASQIKALNLEHTFVFHTKQEEAIAPEAGLIGRFAPYTAGTVLPLYKEVAGLEIDQYSSSEIAAIEAKNITCYTEVEEDPSVFGAGKVGSGEWIHVMLGITWVVTRMREKIWGTIKGANKINYTNRGITTLESDVRTICAEAVDLGIFADDTPISVSSPRASDKTSAERQSGVLSGLKFKARLASAIVKVDGVQGEVTY